MNNTKLTSVKILKILYEDFRVKTINSNMNLQKLTNRAIDMYLTNENFRDELETSLVEGFQDFIFNMFKTTWSKLDPEQMDEARILASGSVSQEQELFGPDEDEEDQPF